MSEESILRNLSSFFHKVSNFRIRTGKIVEYSSVNQLFSIQKKIKMKKILYITLTIFTYLSLFGDVDKSTHEKHADSNLIQVALLLDTSGSMKGLIDQAKCQLWNVISDLEKAKKSRKPISLEIALYKFGIAKDEGGTEENGYLKKVV